MDKNENTKKEMLDMDMDENSKKEMEKKYGKMETVPAMMLSYTELLEAWDYLPATTKSTTLLAHAVGQWAQRRIMAELERVHVAEPEVTNRGNVDYVIGVVQRGKRVARFSIADFVAAVERFTAKDAESVLTSKLQALVDANKRDVPFSAMCPFTK